MSSSKELVGLAKTLPAQLSRFLARYPPAAIRGATADGAEAPKTGYQLDRPNPFVFWKHPETKKWHSPVYSMRRQAELVKMAKEHGVEELLPDTTKQSEYKLAKRVEFGLRVKGTGVGQRVKGHIHERNMLAKMQKRREAMLQMPNLIKAWKRTGKKNWTKFPK
ncbi:probable ribosomal protein YmL25, mitochondrial [Cephalotrichum gorgonifer]|uniref:Probable ribosomal protein YmL25, mitochondrial n=1 Tax=Cephalotrichum gorgonifer TaxID=2041049 RepID=A0AAE8SUE2_9PEZI|nr:probable ribosomal protein YmL25, mitochondrial [Cephalotrichum gorgonifer]